MHQIEFENALAKNVSFDRLFDRFVKLADRVLALQTESDHDALAKRRIEIAAVRDGIQRGKPSALRDAVTALGLPLSELLEESTVLAELAESVCKTLPDVFLSNAYIQRRIVSDAVKNVLARPEFGARLTFSAQSVEGTSICKTILILDIVTAIISWILAALLDVYLAYREDVNKKILICVFIAETVVLILSIVDAYLNYKSCIK